MATLNTVGPNQIRRNEIGYTHARLKQQIRLDFRGRMHLVAHDQIEYHRQEGLLREAEREEDIRYHAEHHALEGYYNSGNRSKRRHRRRPPVH
jgi:hypothetical protein